MKNGTILYRGSMNIPR